MPQQTDSRNMEPAITKVSDETTDRILQNLRNRVDELTAQNTRMRFVLEEVGASVRRELRRKPE